MQTTVHAVAAPRRGRAVGLALALLLQAGFVYALVTGLNIKQVFSPQGPIDVFFSPKKIVPQTPPVDDRMVQPPKTVVAIPPDVIFDTGEAGRDAPTFFSGKPTQSAPGDRGPLGVQATHTIPPYPPLEARLGHEGTVLLRLTISASGVVTDAVVLRSSGYERLDQAARDWVMAHWRYQPAVRGGAAVPSTGNVSVTFNLRTGG